MLRELVDILAGEFSDSSISPFHYTGRVLDTRDNNEFIYVGYFPFAIDGISISDINGHGNISPMSDSFYVFNSAFGASSDFTFVGYRIKAIRPKAARIIGGGSGNPEGEYFVYRVAFMDDSPQELWRKKGSYENDFVYMGNLYGTPYAASMWIEKGFEKFNEG